MRNTLYHYISVINGRRVSRDGEYTKENERRGRGKKKKKKEEKEESWCFSAHTLVLTILKSFCILYK